MYRSLLLIVLFGLLAGCAGQPVGGYDDYQSEGQASWYGIKHQGKRTASGERFDRHALTAAHRSLPFGTRVRVTNLDNDKSVVVRINDRGPHVRARLIDLSQQAAEQIDMLRAGVAPVRVQQLD